MKTRITMIMSIFLLALTIFQSNASPVFTGDEEKKDLIQRMSEDENVHRFVYFTTKLALVKVVKDPSILPPKAKQTLEAAIQEHLQIIKHSYPLYATMSLEEKQEVMVTLTDQILTLFDKNAEAAVSDSNLRVTGLNQCSKEALGGLAGCVGVSGVWHTVKFFACMSASVVLDVAEVVATDGGVTGVLTEEIEGETEFCRWMSSADAISAGVIFACVSGFGSALGVCLVGG